MTGKKISEVLKEYEWWMIGIATLITTVLGIAGFCQYNEINNQDKTFLDWAYLTWQLFSSQSGAPSGKIPLTLHIARWLAPAVVIYAAIKGLLVIARENINLLRLKKFRNHVIICGLGQKGFCLAKGFLAQNRKIVIIETNSKNDEIAALKEKKDVIILIGEATDVVLLKKARIEYADYLFAVTGNDQANIEISIKSKTLLQKNTSNFRLICFFHVFNLRLRQLFYDHEIFKQNNNRINVQLFNLYEKSARLLFAEFSPDKFIAIPRPGSPAVHILVIGFGWMGESFVTQAVRAGHFANEKKIIITIVDKDADSLKVKYLNSYNNIENIADLKFRKMDVEILSKENLTNIQDDLPALAVCYICLGNNEPFNLAVANHIRKLFKDNTPPIIVSMSQKTGISALVNQELLKKANIHLFDVVDSACNVENIILKTLDKKAQAIHECYIERQKAKGDTRKTNSSLITWEETSESEKDSNRCPADHIDIKLRAIECYQDENQHGVNSVFQFTNEELKLLERMEHRRWCAERTLLGWTYAPGNKNKEEKTNPCLVLYDELPEHEKNKDREAIEDIPKVLKKVGQCITRINPA